MASFFISGIEEVSYSAWALFTFDGGLTIGSFNNYFITTNSQRYSWLSEWLIINDYYGTNIRY